MHMHTQLMNYAKYIFKIKKPHHHSSFSLRACITPAIYHKIKVVDAVGGMLYDFSEGRGNDGAVWRGIWPGGTIEHAGCVGRWS